MKRVILAVVGMLIVGVVNADNGSAVEQWVKVGEVTESRNMSYDPASIEKLGNKVMVTVRWYERMMSEGVGELYAQGQVTIDCSGMTYKETGWLSKRKDGSVRMVSKTEAQRDVLPHFAYKDLAKVVCNQ